MKAVFSFWNTSGNALVQATNWANPKFHLYSWTLAVNQAAKFFDEVELVTDSASLPIFKELDLPFTSIRTDLDELEKYPKSFWALGKIKAYQIQDKPFVHIDNDVILFNNILEEFKGKSIVCQNIEEGEVHNDFYQPMINALNFNNVKVNHNWEKTKQSPCMAVYLCNDLEFNKEYCKEVFNFIDNNLELLEKAEQNKIYSKEKDTGRLVHLCYSVIFEQYLAGQVAYNMDKKITPLCENSNFKELEDKGYIHIWGAKNDNKFYKNIERIVHNEYPDKYEIINKLID